MNNVIIAKFSKGVYSTTAKVFRYDVGDKLQFVGLDLPNSYRVDFSNSTMGESKTVFCGSDTVEIPPEYFIPGSTIYAWIVLSQDNGRYTKYQVNIPISARAKPLDIEPTPAQKDALDEAIEALNNVTDDIQGEIDSALEEAKASGEFDGTTIWLYDGTPILPDYTFYKYLLRANANAVVRQFDFILLGSVLYQIISVSEFTCRAIKFVDLKGDPGQSPIVSVRRNDQDYPQIIVDTPEGRQAYDVDNLLTVYFSLGDHWAIYEAPGFTKLGEALRRKCAVLAVVDLPPSEEYGGFRDEQASIIAPLTYWKIPKNESIADNEDLWEFEFKGKADETHTLRIYKNAGVNSKWKYGVYQDDGLTGYQTEQVESIVMGFSGLFLGNYANKAAVDRITWVFNNMPAEELDPLPEGSKYVSERDYVVIQDDETQNHECWRYVWNVKNKSFIPQYRINESPLSNAQLAALNSGITEELTDKLIAMKIGSCTATIHNGDNAVIVHPNIEDIKQKLSSRYDAIFCEVHFTDDMPDDPDGHYNTKIKETLVLSAFDHTGTGWWPVGDITSLAFTNTSHALVYSRTEIMGRVRETWEYRPYSYALDADVVHIDQGIENAGKILGIDEYGMVEPQDPPAGGYVKPSDGIPKTDLASDVQTSLRKADTALQEHQSLSDYATETWVQQQGYLTQHQDISGKLDKNQGTAHAGEFLVVGADGNVITQAVEENNSLAAFATDIASGAIASFTDGADDIPVKDLSIVMEPVQAGSGDPSPSNVRPITGWTGVNVARTGKNLFDKTAPDVMHGYALSTTSGTLYKASSGIWAASGFMPVKGGNQYIISGDTAGNDLVFYDANKVFISGVSDGSKAVMAPANACYARMDYKIANEDRIQFEQSSAATAYEAYHGETHAILFPSEAGTVYGGTLNVTTGKLTVDRAMIASYNGEALPGEWISDRDVYAAGTAPTTGSQVVYALAEPVEYDLTPTEVSTILGENNIWADCGDSTVEYRADTKLYVDKKIAAIPSVPMWNGGSY